MFWREEELGSIYTKWIKDHKINPREYVAKRTGANVRHLKNRKLNITFL